MFLWTSLESAGTGTPVPVGDAVLDFVNGVYMIGTTFLPVTSAITNSGDFVVPGTGLILPNEGFTFGLPLDLILDFSSGSYSLYGTTDVLANFIDSPGDVSGGKLVLTAGGSVVSLLSGPPEDVADNIVWWTPLPDYTWMIVWEELNSGIETDIFTWISQDGNNYFKFFRNSSGHVQIDTLGHTFGSPVSASLVYPTASGAGLHKASIYFETPSRGVAYVLSLSVDGGAVVTTVPGPVSPGQDSVVPYATFGGPHGGTVANGFNLISFEVGAGANGDMSSYLPIFSNLADAHPFFAWADAVMPKLVGFFLDKYLTGNYTTRIEYDFGGNSSIVLCIQSDNPENLDATGAETQLVAGYSGPVNAYDWFDGSGGSRSISNSNYYASGTRNVAVLTRTNSRFVLGIDGESFDGSSPFSTPATTKAYLGGLCDVANVVGRYPGLTIRRIDIYSPRTDEDVLSEVPLRTMSYDVVWLFGWENSLYASMPPKVFGGFSPLVFSLHSGSMPAGMSLDSATGEFVGTPTVGAAGSYPITVRCTDAHGGYLDDSRTILIGAEVGSTWSLIFTWNHGDPLPSNDVAVFGLQDFTELRVVTNGSINSPGNNVYIRGILDNTGNTDFDPMLQVDVAADGTETNGAAAAMFIGGSMANANAEVWLIGWNQSRPKIVLKKAVNGSGTWFPAGIVDDSTPFVGVSVVTDYGFSSGSVNVFARI